MVRSILIGLDGSAYSTSAVDLGIEWARQCDALLVGLGIIDASTICRPEMVPMGAGPYKQHRDEDVLAHARRHVEQFLDHFTRRCTEAGVASKRLEDVGMPYEHILVEAQRYDVILLGQQTYFHFATQEDPCETLTQVLKHTPRPVVTVPETLGGGSSVVIAYDGSLQAARALHLFQASGLAGSQDVHVVTVGDTRVEAARHADRAVEFLRFHTIQAHPHALEAAPAAEVILAQAQQLEARLLVMGAYGQPAWREFFLGSVTRTALHKSPVPLFLYH
jgi:nucleotide-binding universal stress UspA family protein